MIFKRIVFGALVALCCNVGIATEKPDLNDIAQIGHAKNLSRIRLDELERQERELERQVTLLEHKKELTAEEQASGKALFGLEPMLFITAISADRYPLLYLQFDRPERVLVGAGLELDAQQTFGNRIEPETTLTTGTTTSATIRNAFATTHFEVLSMLAHLNKWTRLAIDIQDAGGAADFRNVVLDLGNLKQSPWYVAIGRTRIDFQYFMGNGAYTNTLATQVYRSGFNSPQFILGFYNETVSNTFSIFQAPGFDHMEFADLLVLRKQFNTDVKGMLNFGYIDDVRGIGSGLSNSFDLYSQTTTRTGMFTTGASLGYKLFNLFGMYDTTLQEQAITNFNRLHSFTVGFNLTPKVYGHNTNFTASFTHMVNAEHIASVVPSNLNATSLTGIQNNIVVTYSINITPHVILTPEYNWDRTYNDRTTNTFTLDLMAFV